MTQGGDKKKKNLKKKKLAYNSDSDETESFKKTDKQKQLKDMDISNQQYSSDEEYLSEQDQVLAKKPKIDTKSQQDLTIQKSLKMATLLQKILDTGDDKKPVLSLKRKYEQDIDKQKLDLKAKKMLKLSKREKSDVSRSIPDFSTMVHEKDLRKIATRGGKEDLVIS
jgi:16S rRNA G1207 methylase RsmC